MPPVSEKQRKAMEAAAHGYSTLGIPKSVGKEFVGADGAPVCAGIVFVAPDGEVLLLRRSSAEENFSGHWALPGGHAEEGETAQDAAYREAREECGFQGDTAQPLKLLDRAATPNGMTFNTFVKPVDTKFAPTLNEEHSGYAWAPLDALPQPLHPSVKRVLGEHLGAAADMKPAEWADLRKSFAKWTREEEAEPEHAADGGFEESDHPRDSGGKFGSGAGGSTPIDHAANNKKELARLEAAHAANMSKLSDVQKAEFARGVAHAEKLESAVQKASRDLKAIPGIGSGSMGLTPEAVKATEKYKAARAAYEEAFSTLATFTKKFDKLYGKEVKSEYAHALLKKRMEKLPGAQDALAFDRASIRRVDQDGHLHVEMTPISKANVCPYAGREIPDFEALGLNPEHVYRLYRDPKELAKGAATFAGKPLLLIHKPISADDHPREDVVGAVGDDVEFIAPYLRAPLTIWDGEAIGLIEDEKQKELSSAYRYRADMTPGTADGEPYDGVMRDIVANHVALVKEGRAGPDVVVGDSMETVKMTSKVLTRKAAVAHGALLTYLAPKLATDAKIDLAPSLAGVTGKNFKAKKAGIVSAVKTLTKGKLAQDASIDDVAKLLDALDDVNPAEDEEPDMPKNATDRAKDEEPKGRMREFLKDKLSAEDMAACDAMMDEDDNQEAMDEDDETEEERKKREAKDAKDAKGAKDEDKKDMVTKKAMDAAIASAVTTATETMKQTQRDIRIAEDAVRPYVGKLAMAHDSADGVYRTALTSLGIKIEGVHPSAYRAILDSQPKPGMAGNHVAPIAMDAAGVGTFHELFPEAKSHVVKTL